LANAENLDQYAPRFPVMSQSHAQLVETLGQNSLINLSFLDSEIIKGQAWCHLVVLFKRGLHTVERIRTNAQHEIWEATIGETRA
jgi:hypothetical protein